MLVLAFSLPPRLGSAPAKVAQVTSHPPDAQQRPCTSPPTWRRMEVTSVNPDSRPSPDSTPADVLAAAAILGIGQPARHIFLCVDPPEPKCCTRETGLAAWEHLKRRLKESGLAGPRRWV